MSPVAEQEAGEWRRRLEFQPTIGLLQLLAMDNGLMPADGKAACLELLAERERGAAAASPLARKADAPAPASSEPQTDQSGNEAAKGTAASTNEPAAATKRFDIRISETAILTGVTSEQLVEGLQKGWLKGSDELQRAKSLRLLREAFGHVKSLGPYLQPDPKFGDICAGWAAKLVFSGAIGWAITGPLVRYEVIPEDVAPAASLCVATWLLLSFATSKIPNVGRFFWLGGLFFMSFVAGVSVRLVLWGLIRHPTVLGTVLGLTFAAWLVVVLIAPRFDDQVPIAVEREPVPEALQAQVVKKAQEGAAEARPTGEA